VVFGLVPELQRVIVPVNAPAPFEQFASPIPLMQYIVPEVSTPFPIVHVPPEEVAAEPFPQFPWEEVLVFIPCKHGFEYFIIFPLFYSSLIVGR
jgi:hypothetical protein